MELTLEISKDKDITEYITYYTTCQWAKKANKKLKININPTLDLS